MQVLLLVISTKVLFAIMAACAILSVISFIQIGSAAADKQKGLKKFWWAMGIVFAGIAVYLLSIVIKRG